MSTVATSSWIVERSRTSRLSFHLRQRTLPTFSEYTLASGSSTSAGCARKSFRVEDVLQMVDGDESIMEGSDDEFRDIQEEELHEVLEEDEMEVMSTAYNLHSEAMEVTEGVTAESSNL